MGRERDRYRPGIIEVHIGPMYSGKTDAIFFLHEATQLRRDLQVQLFKPATDIRSKGIYSRSRQMELPAIIIPPDKPEQILEHVQPYHHAIGIDEAQFFDKSLVQVVQYLQQLHKHVVAAGLLHDFRAEPFGNPNGAMPYLMLIPGADIETYHAICNVGGKDADLTQRLIHGEPAPYDAPIISIEQITNESEQMPPEKYEARCLEHHIVPGKPNQLLYFFRPRSTP